MGVMTSCLDGDFVAANTLVTEYRVRYGDLLPLLVATAGVANSLLEAYADVMEEDAKTILQSLALSTLVKNEGKE
jgi:hypothetical protein